MKKKKKVIKRDKSVVEPGMIFEAWQNNKNVWAFSKKRWGIVSRLLIDLGPNPQLRGINTFGVVYEVTEHYMEKRKGATGYCNINTFSAYADGVVTSQEHHDELIAEKAKENIDQLPEIMISILYWLKEGSLPGFTVAMVKELFCKYYDARSFNKINRQLTNDYQQYALSEEKISLYQAKLYLAQF